MNYTEFQRRVEYNTVTLRTALAKNLPLTAILHEVYTWDYEPGELHFHVLMRNAFDIIPSLFLGLLARCDQNGIDAHEVQSDGTVINVEIKTSEIHRDAIWKGRRGGLYTGLQNTKSRRAALTSRLAASYTCHSDSNKLTKNMRTVFMIADTGGANTYVDAFEMEGEAVMTYLHLSNCKTRSIKLGSFMKEGYQSKTVIPLIGFDAWKSDLWYRVKRLAADEFL